MDIRCPLCNSYNVRTTLGGKAKKGGILIAGMGASYLVGSLLSCCGLKGVHTNASRATKSMLRGIVPIDYKCKSCNCYFIVSFTEDKEVRGIKVKKYPIPDEIIQREKDAYIKQLKSGISYIPAILSGLTSIGLFIYCWNTPFRYQKWKEATWFQDAGLYDAWHFSWLFWAFLCFVFFVLAWRFIIIRRDKVAYLNEVKGLDLDSFRSMFDELFEKYDQETLAEYYNSRSLKKE